VDHGGHDEGRDSSRQCSGSLGIRLSPARRRQDGKTNDGTNVWFVGYTADLIAGVWMGLDRPQKIKDNAQAVFSRRPPGPRS